MLWEYRRMANDRIRWDKGMRWVGWGKTNNVCYKRLCEISRRRDDWKTKVRKESCKWVTRILLRLHNLCAEIYMNLHTHVDAKQLNYTWYLISGRPLTILHKRYIPVYLCVSITNLFFNDLKLRMSASGLFL